MLVSGLLLLVEGPAGAVRPPRAAVPVGQGADFTIFSKGTTTDPFEIHTDGPTRLQWAEVSVAPHGSTGLSAGDGIVVATVTEGVATALSSEAGACTTRAVDTGAAIVRPAGSAGEIRNETAEPLELVVVTLTARNRVAALPAGACPAAEPKGVKETVFDASVLDTPLNAESKGSSDIWVGLVGLAPGGKLPWHVQQRPYFLGVGEGHVTLNLANGSTCDTANYASDEGFFEPPLTDHEVRNDTTQRASYYVLGFVPSPQPLIAPAAPQACA
jgi:quercetin dioxygenase-like cupin family protein